MKHLKKVGVNLLLGTALFSFFSFSMPIIKSEYKIADWNNGEFQYYLPNGIKNQIEQAFADSLNIHGSIDSISISDPEPHNTASIPYLQYFITSHGQKIFFAHRLLKHFNTSTNLWEFFITTDLEEELEETGARVVKCTSIENCNGCRKVRTGFLGLGGIVECPCTNNNELFCEFESTQGSNFPWTPVLGFLGVVIAALIADK